MTPADPGCRRGDRRATIGIPQRNMHSQVEIVAWSDVVNAVTLSVEFICRITDETDFRPFYFQRWCCVLGDRSCVSSPINIVGRAARRAGAISPYLKLPKTFQPRHTSGSTNPFVESAAALSHCLAIGQLFIYFASMASRSPTPDHGDCGPWIAPQRGDD
jgi:hypothetical protein